MKLRLLAALAVAGVAAFVAAGSAGAAADSNCPGGILASGLYNNVTVNGFCSTNGEVWIKGNLVVNPGGAFTNNSFFTIVNGSVQVWTGGVLLLANAALTHGVSADHPSSIDVESSSIGGGVLVNGGGGPTANSCNRGDVPLTFRPSLFVGENEIAGSVNVGGRGGCFNVVATNEIGGSLTFVNNQADAVGGRVPGGNFVAQNFIDGNLFCKNNNPHPVLGEGGVNTVLGSVNFPGDCFDLV